MKTVGIIGGVGPKTTVEFYLELILKSQKVEKIARPPILIYSVPLPYAIEKDSILNATGEERNIPYLIEAAKILEKGGADFVVMPCNTLHAFIEDIRLGIKISALSIIEETINFLKNKNVSHVGLISTASTRKNQLYENAFKKVGIIYEVPTNFQQEQINKIIHNLVMGDTTNEDKGVLEDIIQSFANKNIVDIVLACTDLQLLKPESKTIKVYDTMKILADATVEQILK